MVRVPGSRTMEVETFRKHLEARHIPQGDFADLSAFSREGTGFERDRHVFETYHDYLHRTNDYEHEHRA